MLPPVHVSNIKLIFGVADIDECMEGGHGCDQTCVNTPGSYYCNCERGYQIINTTECEGV